MKLSKNFTLSEFTKSQVATRLGIDNSAPDGAIERAIRLFERVAQPVRDQFGPTIITSGYRSMELNRAIGGSKTSQHCLGEAIDLEVPGVSNYEVAKWIKDNLEYDQLILEFYTPGIPDSGWVHVSYSMGGNRKQSLTASMENGKLVYSVGLIV